MLPLGLNAAEREAYLSTLTSSHKMRVEVTIRNRDEKPVATLSAESNRLLSGAVQIDASGDVSRSLELVLLDPKRKLRFEADSPARGAVYADNFVSVEYGVLVDNDWVDCPVFWGPITKFQRSGAQVTIEGQGKEALLLAPYYATQGYTIHKRTRIDDAVERVARRAGERKFKIPKLEHRLAHARTVRPQSEPWRVLNGGEENAHGGKITGLVSRGPGDYTAFYNGRGELVVRKKHRASAFTFTRDHLLSEPVLDYDISEFRNTVDVRGGRRKKEPRAHARVSLDAHHPLSPRSLARHDEPRFMTEFIEAEGLKTDGKCRERANEVLDRMAQQGLNPSFDCLVIPHIEENDRVTLKWEGYQLHFRIREMTIPLTSSESMSVGALKKVKVPRRRPQSQVRWVY